MSDGIVTVDRQRHQDVRGGIGNHCLQEADKLAQDISGMPSHSNSPYDVGRNVDESNS